ncbi:MAG: biotin--[acetyl-CoA-carboxylase] ligase [Acidobacteria bacterium]|nr:biotin--[acetyl-CoA-carboxylase] ligase [Acidobacteriota bacterium]
MKSNPSDLPPDFAGAIARVRPRLGRLASTLLFYRTIGSTNDLALTRSAALSGLPEVSDAREGLVVVADEQTAGRGRRGHTWFSPPGSGLYVSVVLVPSRADDPARAARLLTLAVGVALAEAIEASVGLRADLKWPNDLYVARRKLAGILAEASGDTVVAGYGINVTATSFPPELRDRATSLESELGRACDRAAVFAATLAALATRYTDLLEGRFDAILDAWRRRAPAAHGARVAWTTPAGPVSGVTGGIDDDGALIVRVGDRVERIVAGELTWEV